MREVVERRVFDTDDRQEHQPHPFGRACVHNIAGRCGEGILHRGAVIGRHGVGHVDNDVSLTKRLGQAVGSADINAGRPRYPDDIAARRLEFGGHV